MEHIINENGVYSGHITVVPPPRHGLNMEYTRGVVLLVLYDYNNHKPAGRHCIAGQDNDSILDTFKHIPHYEYESI